MPSFVHPNHWRAALLAAGLALSGSIWADHDHDAARDALRSGQIRPLSDILDRLSHEQPGQVLEVELEHGHGRWFYEIKLLTPSGTLRRLKIDAAANELIPPAEHRDSDAPAPLRR